MKRNSLLNSSSVVTVSLTDLVGDRARDEIQNDVETVATVLEAPVDVEPGHNLSAKKAHHDLRWSKPEPKLKGLRRKAPATFTNRLYFLNITSKLTEKYKSNTN